MEYKVGTLADLISGTHNAVSRKKGVVYVPFQNKKTTAAEITPKSASSLQKKRKVHSDEEIHPSGEGKRKKKFSEGNTEEKIIKVDNEEKKQCDEKREIRTVFVKNIPLVVDKKRLKKIFKKYGSIECIRFRCAPQGDIRIPKRVTVIKKEFHQDRTSISAFIRFCEEESVEKALEANGSLIDDHRIFVDRVVKGQKHDQNKAIFLGNVPFGAEENEIWNIFADCGEIEDIRIVRDRETGLGKGFAFVNFKSSDGVELAMTLQGIKLKEKELRVMRVTDKLKRTSNQQNNNMSRSKKNPLKRTGHERNWKRNKKNFENKEGKEKKISNENYAQTEEEKRLNKPRFSVNSRKNQNTLRQFFQGHTFSDKKKSSDGVEHERNLKSNKERKQKKKSNEDYAQTPKENRLNEPRFSVNSRKKQNTPRQSFQGQTLSDKKKKKKINKNEQRKKKIAKMLTGSC